MAASDARPVPRKNAAFRFYFAIRKPSDSTLITTWAGQDSEVSLDGGSFADCTNEATEIGTTGCGYIDLTAAEMNADAVVLKVTVTNSGAVPLVFTLFPEEAGDYRVSDAQKVDVETIKTQTLTAAAGITFPSSIASPTNITAATGVTLAAVTHTGAVIPTVSAVTGLTASNLDVATSTLATAANLAIVAGYLDTEIAAIKAKTDQLTFTTANKVDSTAVLDSDARVKLAASQPDYVPATAANLALAKTILDKIDTGLVLDGAVYQFTANMLELAPAGGGGAGDASQATLLEVKAKTDLIGTAAGLTSLLAAAVLEPGTITSFPETLTIGDSYTEQNGREIQIPIVDTDGNPISSTGSLNFADASVTFTLQRSGETDSTRVITGSATFVDPPGTGTGAGAPYAVVELPASETAKGLKKYKYSGILTFLWTYAGTGTADDVMSFETGTVTFEGQ